MACTVSFFGTISYPASSRILKQIVPSPPLKCFGRTLKFSASLAATPNTAFGGKRSPVSVTRSKSVDGANACLNDGSRNRSTAFQTFSKVTFRNSSARQPFCATEVLVDPIDPKCFLKF